jgi:integrase
VDGKQIKQHMTYKPIAKSESRAYKEAQHQAALFEEQCKQGQQVTAVVKFEQFASEYLKDVAPSNLKANTLANYHNYSKRTFFAIGHLRLDKITPRHIQKFIKDLETGERFDKYRKGALSAKTIKNHIAFISSVFEYARKMQVLSFNPCGSVILPKDRAEEQQQEIYTVEETQNILELLCKEEKKNFHYTVYFLLAVYTGFRRGELLGLGMERH